MASKAGYILALIGGILTLIGSVIFLVYGIISYTALRALTMGFGKVSVMPLVGGIGGMIWFIVAGILAIIAAKKMNQDDPTIVKKGGIMAIIVGVLSGGLLTLIGGIIGVIQASESNTIQSKNL